MDARVRTRSPATGIGKTVLSHPTVSSEPGPKALAQPLPREQWSPRLTAYHRRCLGKRLGDCHEELAQAICALGEAQRWAPWDSSLEAARMLVTVAREITALARSQCGERHPAFRHDRPPGTLFQPEGDSPKCPSNP
jgi:hypothetical protein